MKSSEDEKHDKKGLSIATTDQWRRLFCVNNSVSLGVPASELHLCHFGETETISPFLLLLLFQSESVNRQVLTAYTGKSFI